VKNTKKIRLQNKLKLDRVIVRVLTPAELERVVAGEGTQTLAWCCTKEESARLTTRC
jgi:hypothetical protein